MILRISLVALVSLLLITLLATLSAPAHAHVNAPAEEFSASRIMAMGPLNVVVYRVSGR